MARRIFLALPISNETEEGVLVFRNKYRNLPVRWIKGNNLHVTIVPPWNEENVEEIKSKLDSLVFTGNYSAEFHRISFGPNPLRPSLIWAEAKVSKDLLWLEKDVNEKFNSEPSLRPWKAHLTLARFREEDFQKFSIKNLNEKISWAQDFSSIVLMESHLDSNGAEYEIIHEIKLN